MNDILPNPFRGQGLACHDAQGKALWPASDASAVAQLLSHCPAHGQTPLRDMAQLAKDIGIDALWVKDERGRMGLGSFKALGAAFAIARAAMTALAHTATPTATDWASELKGRVFVTASAGNHGLSVAAGAHIFGAKAVIFLAETVPTAFAERLNAKGAQVVRAGATYEDSMQAAADAATQNGWTLLSDSSWPGYCDLPHQVMEGYLQLAAEATSQVPTPPTHILLQAGVGGLAAAVAAHARAVWGDAPQIIVVEPEAAPALLESIRAGELVTTSGPVSAMGRLDCKTPSMIALAGLSRDADIFMTISESEAASCVATLAQNGLTTTPSGGAGLAGLLTGRLSGFDATSRVMAILSEGAEDA